LDGKPEAGTSGNQVARLPVMVKEPLNHDLPDPDDTGFYMTDPVRCERIPDYVFSIRHRIWSVILQRTDDRGFIGHTQKSLAIQFDVSERQIRSHFAVFKKAKMIEKANDSEGRVRFRVCPEYFFNFDRQARNKQVRERQHESGLRIVQGGKSKRKTA